jgi:hypothetical protein
MEEDTAPTRRNNTLLLSGMRATRNSFMRFTRPQGHMEESSSDLATRHDHPLHLHTLRSIPRGFVIMTEEEEEEEKLARLE